MPPLPSRSPHPRPGGPRPTRERILDAAEVLFAERGLRGTAVRDIAREVGLTPASLYNHFAGKQALYEAVLERGTRPLLELLQGLADREHSPDASDEIVGSIMDHLARRPHLPRLVQHEACSGGHHMRRLARQWIRPLIDQGVRELGRDTDSPWTEEEFPLVISAWLHLIFGHFATAPLLAEVFDEDPLSPEALKRQTAFLRKLALIFMSGRPETPVSTPTP